MIGNFKNEFTIQAIADNFSGFLRSDSYFLEQQFEHNCQWSPKIFCCFYITINYVLTHEMKVNK